MYFAFEDDDINVVLADVKKNDVTGQPATATTGGLVDYSQHVLSHLKLRSSRCLTSEHFMIILIPQIWFSCVICYIMSDRYLVFSLVMAVMKQITEELALFH